MIRKILAAALPAAALLAMLPGEAEAGCCVAYDYGHAEQTVSNAESSIKGHFTTQINAMQLAIIEAQRLSTGQISGNLKEQNAANANIADLQDDRAVVARIEEARRQAALDAASGASTCNVITGNIGGASTGIVRQVKRRHLGSQMTDWTLGKDGPSSRGADAALRARLDAHCKAHGTELDVRMGVCEKAVEESLQDADVTVTKSVFFVDGNSGTLPPEREEAARRFAINIIDPRPLGALPAGIGNDVGGSELMSARIATAGRTSLAMDAVVDAIARRSPMNQDVVGAEDAAQSLNEWAEGTAKDVLGYNKNGGNFPNGVSWNDWMELRSKSWFLNPTWAAAAKSPGQTIKDMAMMQAFEVYQNWETYQLLEKININLATQLAIMNENSREASVATGK